MISVLLADDHVIFREGLRQIIAIQPDMQVCGEASDGAEALRLLQRTPCDVLVLDLSMPGPSGVGLISRIHALLPKLPILVLSMHQQHPYMVEALRGGASGYVTKASPSAQLLDGIRRVARGGTFASDAAAEQLAVRLRQPDGRPPHMRLTSRELQVFHLLVSGLRVGEIARQLNLSEKTVSTHKTRIQDKIDASSAADLVRYAIRHGLIADDDAAP